MTILGLSKAWFITLIVTVLIVIGGAGLIAVIVTTIFIAQPVSALPSTTEPTVEPTDQPTEEPTGQPTEEPTVEPTDQPQNGKPSLSFRGDELRAHSLCNGVYHTQGTLTNHGDGVAANVVLGWEVVKGAEWVDEVSVTPYKFAQLSAHEDVQFDISARVVNDSWWQQPDGTEIKIRLYIEKEDNRPGHHQTQAHVTLVKRGRQWVTLNGYAASNGVQSYLVDGNIVNVDECTYLPTALPPGSLVQVIAIQQPDNTFVAVSVVIITTGVDIGDFVGGGGGSSGGSDDDGGSSGGSGGSRGGSGGSGGSRGGSK